MSETRPYNDEAERSYGIQALVALQCIGIVPDRSKNYTAWIVTLEPDGQQPSRSAPDALRSVLAAVERGGLRAVSENFREFLDLRGPLSSPPPETTP